MRKFSYKKISCGTLSILCCLLMVSCEKDPGISQNCEINPVLISASIAQNTYTRAYQQKGPVEEGTYYLTYSNPEANPPYNMGTVNFYEGTGFITTSDGNELTWKQVGFDPSGSIDRASFFMDNVRPLSQEPSTIVTFGADNPFVAGKFDYTDGTNDLLWGSTTVERETGKVPMSLHHVMSMIRIEVTVDASASGSLDLDLTDAEVEITNIALTPLTFDRLTGNLDLGDTPDYGPLGLVIPNIGWMERKVSPGNAGIVTYRSADIVLPPQSLLQDENRPRLTITVPQKDGGEPRKFSGSLPRAMVLENPDGTSASLNFSFLREHILTLKVTMNPDLMVLEYMPVTVVEWVDRGTYLATGAQSAIFDDKDFMAMIEAYAADDEDKLSRYGYQKDSEWIFNIYGDLVLREDEIKGKMKAEDGESYKFKFNGQTVTVILSDGSRLELSDDNDGPQKLFEILNGN